MGVDFDNPRSHHDMIHHRHAERTTWGKRLAELRAGIEAGRGEYDVFYKVASYKNASGARTAIRQLMRKDALPGVFDLEPRVVVHADGSRTSEVWAAMVPPEVQEGEF